MKLPLPGETWRHKNDAKIANHEKDYSPAIIAAIGDTDRQRDYSNSSEGVVVVKDYPDAIVFWVPSEKYKGTTFRESQEKFLANYEFVSDAQEQRDKLLAEVTVEMAEITATTKALESGLLRVGAGSTELSSETAVALNSDSGVEIADRMKRSVADLRNEVTKNQIKVKAAMEKMADVARENAMAIKARMHGIQKAAEREAARLMKMVDKAQEIVWTFNLYLGKEETIRVLRDGTPAAKNEKIVIRQLVLFMDEESALHSDEGGIDFSATEEFDEWLLADPKHIEQVLPNIRGIVAIKPRRKAKGYDTGNAMLNAKLESFNKHTYFLIRNGERVFRIDTDLEVDETLTPKSDEFLKLFQRTKENYGRRGRVTREQETIKPGDSDYMDAMEKASGRERHFMRVFLFLQGLLDRTTVFHPFEVPRVNVFDMKRQDQHIEFALDAETGRQIGDGRPEFKEWQKTRNDQLEVGMRVIGIFPAHDYHGRETTFYTQPTGMHSPDSEELHTLTDVQEGGYHGSRFFFHYKRDTERSPVWGRDPWDRRKDAEIRTPRIRIWFNKDWPKYIAYDLVTAEEMRYYLSSRINRHEYKDMFPVLQRAIKFKEKEAKEEAPFRRALVGAIMRDHKVDENSATDAVNELVSWWKYKTKEHRALLSDDEKASRMILAEHARRARLAVERTKHAGKLKSVTDVMVKNDPTIIAIYHKEYSEFVVFHAENENNIFVREVNWKSTRNGGDVPINEDRWTTTDTARMRNWLLLHGTDRWSAWQHNADIRGIPTDPELKQIKETSLAAIKSDWEDPKRGSGSGDDRSPRYWNIHNNDHGEGVRIYIPLADYLKDGDIEHWFWSRRSRIPNRRLTGQWSEPQLVKAVISASRDKDGAIETEIQYTATTYNRSPFIKPEKFNDFFDERNFPEPTWSDPVKIAELEKEFEAYQTEHEKIEEFEPLRNALREQVLEAMKQEVLVGIRAKFDQDYGDPELWENHLKNLQLPEFDPHAFDSAINYALQVGVRPVGLTVEQLFGKAKEFGWKGEMEPERSSRSKKVVYAMPMQYTFVEPSIPKEEEYDEEDDLEVPDSDD